VCGVYDRGKTMSESKRVKVSSVAAFMWLPQFHLSFRGFAHIVPVFVRTVAMVFVAAGLIPNNHPATRYGVEGVEKYSLSNLLGEVWFNLRRTNASTHQWGLFVSVVMMMVAIFSAFGAFVLTVFFNLGAVAHAQIFSYPTDIGVASPYGSGDETDMDAVQGLGNSPDALFDLRVSTGGSSPDHASSSDYALMVLDKVLRQAAVGTGGAMQNGLAGMMEVYNSGIMVVAAVMIFWMILSIVVDTAKTGIVGGGRHNMVWTPIRVVFALGIMVPLGSTGFSSGQFMVMKLAEWGSSFGSRLWAQYTTDVVADATLLVDFNPEGAMQVTRGIAQIMTCQIAYNVESNVVMGGSAGSETLIAPISRYDRDTYTTQTIYTNRSNPNLCGSISFPGKGSLAGGSASDDEYDDALIALTETDLTNSNLGEVLLNYRNAVSAPLRAAVDETGGWLLSDMRGIACSVAASVFSPEGAANPVTSSSSCSGASLPSGCSMNGAGLPSYTCLEDSYNKLRDNMATAEATARSGLNDWISANLVNQMAGRGWGGMGTWYVYLNKLNRAVKTAETTRISVAGGSLWQSSSERRNSGGVAGFFGFTETGEFRPSHQAHESMVRFENWWGGEAVEASASNRDLSAQMSGVSMGDPDEGIKGIFSMLKGTRNAREAISAVMYRFMPGASMWQGLLRANDDGVYPYVRLVSMGEFLSGMGLNIIIVNTLLAMVTFEGSIVIASVTVGDWGETSLASIIGTVGKALFLGGVMLGVYLPIVPLLRVALAVLTWITSVFEAVVMVPIAALAHLSSEGEGLAGGARTAWILWLNVLLRPGLVVVGFVGATLIFNAFAVYFMDMFANSIQLIRSELGAWSMMISLVTYTIVFYFTLYTAVNTCFKLIDIIPDAMMRWIPGASPDKSFDNDNDGLTYAAANMIMNSPRGRMGLSTKAHRGDNKTGAG